MLSGASQSRVGCVSYYSANDTITPAMSTVARLASNHPMHRATLELEVEDVSPAVAERQANGVKLGAGRAHCGLGQTTARQISPPGLADWHHSYTLVA